MAWDVRFTRQAERDLSELYGWIAAHDSPAKADHVAAKIEAVVDGLATTPARGAVPRELAALGVRDFREVFFKPYRIVYCIRGRKVFVVLIADGRRDMQSLLERRLLAP